MTKDEGIRTPSVVATEARPLIVNGGAEQTKKRDDASNAIQKTAREKKHDALKASFDWVPEHLRTGPWSPIAAIVLVVWFVLLACYAPTMYASAQESGVFSPDVFARTIAQESGSSRWWVLLALFLWVGGNCLAMAKKWGPAVFATFTLYSYVLLLLRFFCQVLGPKWPALGAAGEILRLPSLIQATCTFFVWNCVLAPGIYLYFRYRGDEERKNNFVDFNKGYFMLCIHLLNLPVALLDVAFLSTRALVFADLWIAFVFVFVYALFYLLVLDRNGVFLYPIFSPRNHFCFIPYLSLIALYIGGYQAFQTMLSL
jgi:hypothetical protein